MGNIETADEPEVGAPEKYGDEGTATLSAIVQENERFDTPELALRKADLHNTLNKDVPHTIFGPQTKHLANCRKGR